ncbi:hypothetical protein BHM03_00059716, partial [Ensete ventricosum]
ALVLFPHPHCVAIAAPAPVAAALVCRQSPYKGRSPLQPAPLPPVGDCPLQAGRSYGRHAASGRPYEWLPLQGGLATTNCPLVGGQAMVGRPCKGLDHGQPPLQRAWPWPATLFPRCLRYKNIARTRRTVLHNAISSHAV